MERCTIRDMSHMSDAGADWEGGGQLGKGGGDHMGRCDEPFQPTIPGVGRSWHRGNTSSWATYLPIATMTRWVRMLAVWHLAEGEDVGSRCGDRPTHMSVFRGHHGVTGGRHSRSIFTHQ